MSIILLLAALLGLHPAAYAQAGAPVPFVLQNAVTSPGVATNGTVIGPNYYFGNLATEANGRQAVLLAGAGKYVSFTLTAPANAITVHYAIPDAPAGGGITEPLSLYANGSFATSLSLTSAYSWLYGSYTFTKTPGLGLAGALAPHDFYNDVRYMFPSTLPQGTVVKLQVDAGDNAPWYIVNTAAFEVVPAAIPAPSNSINVTQAPYNADNTGATDSTSALTNAINAAEISGQTVYIPTGTYTISAVLYVNKVTIEGAGEWYTVITGSDVEFGGQIGNPSTNVNISNLALFGNVAVRNDGDGNVNGLNGGFSNSTFSNLWIQNTKVGAWIVGPVNNLTLTNLRILDLKADGINFNANGLMSNGTITDNYIQNAQDDGIALWAEDAQETGIAIDHNTVLSPGLANNVAIYGPGGASITNNLLEDPVTRGSCVQSGTRYGPSTTLPISIENNQLERCGQYDPGWDYGIGAMWFYPQTGSITTGVTISGNTIIDSPYSAYMFLNPGNTSYDVTGVTVDGDTLTNVGSYVVDTEIPGSISFTNVTASGVADGGFLNLGNAAFTVSTSGDAGWSPTPAATAIPNGNPLWVYPDVVTFQTTEGSPNTQQVAVLNAAYQTTTIGAISPSSGFSETDNCVGTPLAAAQYQTATEGTCTINVTFNGAGSGITTGTLTIPNSAGNAVVVQLVGSTGGNTQNPQPTVTPTSLTFAPQLVGTTSAPVSVTLSNPTGAATLAVGAISITPSVGFTQTDTCGSSLAAGASCTISVKFAPASAGTQSASLSIATSLSTITVALSGSASAPPSIPTGLLATSAGSGAVTVSWKASTGSAPITYNVYRGVTSGGEGSTPVATGVTALSYTDTGLTNGTSYYYEVSSTNSVSTSGKSAEVAAAPSAPLLQIDAGGAGAAPFVADEDFNTGTEFSTGSTVSLAGVGNPAPEAVYQTVRWASSFAYTIPNLTAGTSYVVRLHFAELSWTAAGQRVFNVAINGTPVLTNFDIVATGGALQAVIEQFTAAANSSGQIVISFTQGTADNPEIAGIEILGSSSVTTPPTAPSVPAGLAATPGSGSVSLSWSASTGTAPITYNVYRGATSGGETLVASGISTTNYSNTGLTSGTYYYEVSATNSVATSGKSTEVSATVTPTGTTPSVPANPAATAGTSSISFSWSASTGTAPITYNVYRGTASGGETLLTSGISTTSYADSSVVSGTTYYYEVTATNSVATSGRSAEVSATVTPTGTAPSIPTGLAAAPGSGSISLSWAASTGSTPITYNIYRGTASGSETLLASAIAANSYTDSSVVSGTTYYYKVSAINSVGTSGLSSEVNAGASPASTRMVFAHYMVTNQDYQDDSDPTGQLKVQSYEKEIQQAQAAGINGFALNAGSWLSSGTASEYYIAYAAQMFQAAVNLNSGFKLFFSIDFCCGNGISDAEDAMRRFANDPVFSQVYFKYNGKFVLSTFSGDELGTAAWAQIRSDLANGTNPSTQSVDITAWPTIEVGGPPSNAGLQVEIVPAFIGAFGGEVPTESEVQSGFNTWSPYIDGALYWGIAGVPGSGGSLDQITSSEAYASVLHAGGKVYMAPVCLQFWGSDADRYFEYGGYSGIRKMWMDAINVSHPDWVEIITWNDFIEGSYVSPIDDPNKYPFANFLTGSGLPSQPGPLGYFHSHEGATALLPYFIQWYKTGVQPTISNDSIFWAYRTQSVNDQAASNVPAVNSGTNYGPIADEIYVTANLAQPGILTVTSGSKVTSFTLTPGGTDVQAPFVDGNTPSFTFTPTGSSAPELSGSGTDPIGIYTYLPAGGTAIQYNDEYYSTGDLIGAPLKTAPQAPTLSPAIAGNASVALNWTASFGSTPITYNVYRGTSSGGESSTPIATGLSVLTYTDSTALNGTTYYYVVKGINSFGTSPNSNEVNATPSAPTLPSVPAVQTPTSGEGTISLTWSASTGTAPITYTVYRGTTSGGEVQLAAGLVTTTYTDTGLANNTTYYYVVSATNAAGTSKKSNEVSSTTLNVLLQIDSGGPGASPFVADEDFSAGGNEFSAGSTVSLTGVVSPAPEAVYQTVRWASSFTYTIPNLTAGNSYLVRLHFAELTWTAAGQRVFNVAINGTPVLTNFDIFATAGGLQALVEQFNAIANSSGQVVVSFTQGTADNPEVAGIEILGSTTSTPTAATPAFNPAAGTYTSAQSVTLSDSTSGAAIYYTTNGTTPTVSSTKYTGAIGVSATETIEAIAIANGYNNSAVAPATYTISTPTAATPAFSPGAGTYTSAQSVTLSDATSGAKIYYTTNGTAPTTSSTLYSGAIAVSATETIEAIAVASGYNNSAVATAAYTISTMSPATITASVTSLAFGTVSVGSSSVPQTVALKNTGSSTATISSITAGTGFTETNTCGSSLAVGASCTASVVFTPTSATSFSANLTVSSNATDGTLTVALTGTGGSSTTNLALSATATAGSSASGYPASNVNDGNTSTYWESLDGAAYPQTLTLNFGKVESLGSVTLTLPPSTAWTTRTETLSVLGSNNGTSWTTIVASAGYTFNPSTTPSNTVSFNLPAGTSYQYLQLSFTANTGWTAAQISEFEVYSGTTGSGEGPFGGTPAAIPGTVLAENYDTGGQGIAYNVTSVNGTDNSYRSDGVDLETATSPATGNDLGWTASGQWFKYTVNVATAGTYTVSFLVAAPSAVTDGFHLSNSSGTNLSGAVNVTATGGWQDWATVTATVTLPAGLQVLTLNEDNAGWNIDTATFAVQ